MVGWVETNTDRPDWEAGSGNIPHPAIGEADSLDSLSPTTTQFLLEYSQLGDEVPKKEPTWTRSPANQSANSGKVGHPCMRKDDTMDSLSPSTTSFMLESSFLGDVTTRDPGRALNHLGLDTASGKVSQPPVDDCLRPGSSQGNANNSLMLDSSSLGIVNNNDPERAVDHQDLNSGSDNVSQLEVGDHPGTLAGLGNPNSSLLIGPGSLEDVTTEDHQRPRIDRGLEAGSGNVSQYMEEDDLGIGKDDMKDCSRPQEEIEDRKNIRKPTPGTSEDAQTPGDSHDDDCPEDDPDRQEDSPEFCLLSPGTESFMLETSQAEQAGQLTLLTASTGGEYQHNLLLDDRGLEAIDDLDPMGGGILRDSVLRNVVICL